MSAYYSEHDPQKAEWLRVLIEWGEIAPGVVDERDMQEIRPEDLEGYAQVHLCAGIGLWSLALRRADWPDDRPVWTASFPCQPFSVAGKGRGADDPRHLWPCGEALIRECRPVVVFGEQVADGSGRAWLESVCADLDKLDYAVGSCVLPAAGVGAPHQRHRTYFVAHPVCEGGREDGRSSHEDEKTDGGAGRDQCESANHNIPTGGGDASGLGLPGEPRRWAGQEPENGRGGERMGEPICSRLEGLSGDGDYGHEPGRLDAGPAGPASEAGGPGMWDRCQWVLCRDPKRGLVWRPTEPALESLADGCSGRLVRGGYRSTFPVVKGASARTLRIRGYGDGICLPVAEAFIKAYVDSTEAGRVRDWGGASTSKAPAILPPDSFLTGDYRCDRG